MNSRDLPLVRGLAALVAVVASALLFAAPALATTEGAGWELSAHTFPSIVQTNTDATIVVNALNIGAQPSNETVTVTDTLPPGVKAIRAGAMENLGQGREPTFRPGLWNCTGNGPGGEVAEASVLTCTSEVAHFLGGGGGPTRGLPNPELAIKVAVGEAEGVEANSVSLAGEGAATLAATTNQFTVSGAVPPAPEALAPEVQTWDGWFSNADGSIDTQAGSHPYAATFDLDLATMLENGEELRPAGGEARTVEVMLPPGFVGNPTAVPTCPRQTFEGEACPRDTQVGYLTVITPYAEVPLQIFNLAPPPGIPAEFGFTLESVNTFGAAALRTGGDYGIDTDFFNVPQKIVLGNLLTIWGVPHAKSHDNWRSHSLGGCGEECSLPEPRTLKPFLTLPSACAGPQEFKVRVGTWGNPGTFVEKSFSSHDALGSPSGFTGCNKLPFEPTISAKPTTNVADAPSGLNFDLHFPLNGFEEPEAETTEANLKDAVVTLPKGMAVNPASANGLGACTEAQIELNGPNPATCPDAAKIGSVEIDTPLLGERDEAGEVTALRPLHGGVYVAQPFANKFGSLLAIYLAVDDPQTGTVVKLAGEVKTDPQTGQLTTSFAHNPQLPFEDFKLDFFGGAKAALRTPSTCGPYTTASDMTPWSSPEGADAFPADSFELTQAPGGAQCPTAAAQLPNKPAFTAGTLTPKAAAYSPFTLHLARADGSQEIKGIDTTLPEGLIGKLAGISECSEAQIAQAASRDKPGQGALEQSSPSCPLASEVGAVNIGAGAGPDPYYVQGHAYLAGPYKGAPLSLEIITPAVAGPYDLGAVAVRTALYVNPETAQIHAVSDPIPTILAGIPLDVRSIDLDMSRPQFTLNPTSCEKKLVLGDATSALGQSAPLTSPFQVGECSQLGFKPKLSIKLKGGTKRNQNPALKAVLTYPSKGAYSNIAKASVALPHSEFLDQAHIKTICTRVVFAEGQTPGEKCPAASVYGFARATTPLLDKPLEGPVYLRSSSHNLPDLVAALNGQIDVDLDGQIDTDKQDGIRNSFEVVPDAPVSKFTLEMQGGKKGLLVNSEDICRKPQRATVKLTAQNGKSSDTTPLIGNGCGGKKSKKHRKGQH